MQGSSPEGRNGSQEHGPSGSEWLGDMGPASTRQQESRAQKPCPARGPTPQSAFTHCHFPSLSYRSVDPRHSLHGLAGFKFKAGLPLT